MHLLKCAGFSLHSTSNQTELLARVRLAEVLQMISTLAAIGCPECEGQINLSLSTLKGEIMMCPDCGAELEVTGTNPLKLELAPMVEEDWGE